MSESTFKSPRLVDPRLAAAATGYTGQALIDLWTPPASATRNQGPADLGQMLIAAGHATPEQVTGARTVAAKSPGTPLAELLCQAGAHEVGLQRLVAELASLPFETIREETLDAHKALHRLGLDYCQAHGVLPLREEGARVVLGVVDPDNLLVIDEVRHRLGQGVRPVVICRSELAVVIERKREEKDGESGQTMEVSDIIADIQEDDVEVVQNKDEDLDLERAAGESPVIRFVNYLIFNAVKEGASDIHIEPQEKKLQIRYRIDGVMFDAMNPPHHMQSAIISRLKIMSNLDIAERRLPQDGRIRAMVHGRKLDLRLSTLPTVSGEKAVMRILDTRSIQVSLDDLGMDPHTLDLWKHQIKQPHGIVLVTGPTGSGKTTTLYASLGQMDRQKLNISTTEDPVEYHLGGINQTQVSEAIGMTFSAGLRALLRQDPDVIMVGEIRDAETARIAIQASLTGHLVLSTLHTNDAPSSVTRLINIGVEPYLIGAAMNACLAQRLTRRLCPHCKRQQAPEAHVVEHLTRHGLVSEEVWHGPGCDRCRNTGYAGRVGLYELLVLNDTLRDRVVGSPNVTEFRRMCVDAGMFTLRQDGFKKVASGMTTVDEVLRVTES